MDPRGATALVEDPAGQAQALAIRTGIEIPNIQATSEHTRMRVQEIERALADEEIPSGCSICLFGSWAREELTPHSDDDWAVIHEQPRPADDPQAGRAVAIARRHLGGDGRAPGSQDIFGVPFDVESLVKHVGLDKDTNTNLTRRMLLLLESREVAGELHPPAWQSVLRCYLNYGVKPYRPPRFLLNDLTRYWRTICVDFEGKHKDTRGDDPKWVSRNAKLRTSRKLLFAAGLVPLLLCHLHDTDSMETFLGSWLRATPLDRLAAAFLWAGAEPEGARALRSYDRWLRIQRDGNARAELRTLRHDTRPLSPLFREIADIGRQFERAVIALLFDTNLAGLSQQYAVF